MADTEGLQKIALHLFDYVANRNYLYGMLTAMQAQTDADGNLVAVDSSACLVTFDEFADEISARNLNDVVAAKEAYELSRSEKGA